MEHGQDLEPCGGALMWTVRPLKSAASWRWEVDGDQPKAVMFVC